MILFAGVNIFGQYVHRQIGPIARTRNLREQLPGVVGYRNYLLTDGQIDTQVWTITAIYLGLTVAQCQDWLIAAQSYMNGMPYPFTSQGGAVFPNCELIDYRQVGNLRRAVMPDGNFYTVMQIQATIERMSP